MFHSRMKINGSLLCAKWLSENVTDLMNYSLRIWNDHFQRLRSGSFSSFDIHKNKIFKKLCSTFPWIGNNWLRRQRQVKSDGNYMKKRRNEKLTWFNTTIICFSMSSNDDEDSHDRNKLSRGLNWNQFNENQKCIMYDLILYDDFTICLWKRSSCWERLSRNSKHRSWWYFKSAAYSGQLSDQTKNVSRIASLRK